MNPQMTPDISLTNELWDTFCVHFLQKCLSYDKMILFVFHMEMIVVHFCLY